MAGVRPILETESWRLFFVAVISPEHYDSFGKVLDQNLPETFDLWSYRHSDRMAARTGKGHAVSTRSGSTLTSLRGFVQQPIPLMISSLSTDFRGKSWHKTETLPAGSRPTQGLKNIAEPVEVFAIDAGTQRIV